MLYIERERELATLWHVTLAWPEKYEGQILAKKPIVARIEPATSQSQGDHVNHITNFS